MLNNQKGVTLLELLISITLFAILLIPMSNLFLLSFQTTGATTVQLSDRAIAVDILEGLKDASRTGISQFTYAGKSFPICSGNCTDVQITVAGKNYTVAYKINPNYRNSLSGITFHGPASVALYKIDVTLKPSIVAQGEEEINYSVIVARKP